jgi:hypothetical protein
MRALRAFVNYLIDCSIPMAIALLVGFGLGLQYVLDDPMKWWRPRRLRKKKKQKESPDGQEEA